LEEYGQQFSDQFTLIFEIVWTGASPTQNKGTGKKICNFQVLIAENWNCFDGNYWH
jgi:hypothetical protein